MNTEIYQCMFDPSRVVPQSTVIFLCPDSRMLGCFYMTVHQQDSSQPQQSHDSPQDRTGAGLTMEETDEAMLPGMMMVLMLGAVECGLTQCQILAHTAGGRNRETYRFQIVLARRLVDRRWLFCR
jgi:hypothetical protein